MERYGIGLRQDELDTPTLCLDADRIERNIVRMAAFLQDKPAKLRPHFKTHKSPVIAWKQLRAGAIGITCAKLSEAEVLAQAGIPDILIANQIIGSDKIARLAQLSAWARVTVAVEDADHAAELATAARAKGIRQRVILEVDTGMGRCGVQPGVPALELARRIALLPELDFCGMMGYEGHAVMIADRAERRRVAEEALARLVATRDLLVQHGIPVEIVSAGGSGTYDIAANYPGITDLQCGSYATMDAKYRSVGLDFEQALTLMARVISVRGDDHAVIDAGIKSLTTEFGLPQVVRPTGWAIARLSEEHGVLVRQGGAPLRRGDRVEIIPSHGCTTINLHEAYTVLRGGAVEAVWPVAGRGCVR